MRATAMYGTGDVRVEDMPDPRLREPTDAVVRVLRAGICGSDLWPYPSMPLSPQGRRMGHEFLGVVAWVADPSRVKCYTESGRGELALGPRPHAWRSAQPGRPRPAPPPVGR